LSSDLIIREILWHVLLRNVDVRPLRPLPREKKGKKKKEKKKKKKRVNTVGFIAPTTFGHCSHSLQRTPKTTC